VGKVFSREELERIGELCVKYNLIILSDEVYDRLFYVPFTRIATLSPELYERTLTVGSAGKAFYATGWRVGYLIGPEHLIKYVAGAHTRICYSSVSPLQEAAAVAFEKAEEEGFWDESRTDMQNKIKLFCEVFDELGLPVCDEIPFVCLIFNFNFTDINFSSTLTLRADTLCLSTWLQLSFQLTILSLPMSPVVLGISSSAGSLSTRLAWLLFLLRNSTLTTTRISPRIISALLSAKTMTFLRLLRTV
jgi:hypothetical protein